jgi:hypothetical protein
MHNILARDIGISLIRFLILLKVFLISITDPLVFI